MKRNIIITILSLVIYCLWLYLFVLIGEELTLDVAFMSLICMIATWVIIIGIKQVIWRYKNGVDLWATLETDPEKVKEHMLFIMQYGHTGGIVGALNEFNDIFRNYPQWELKNWEVFKAWYKAEIDYMIKYPKIYGMTMKYDGSPYSKEKDPLYDPNAPDWALYDRDRSLEDYDYDEDSEDYDDSEDDNDNKRPSLREAAKNGFYMGLGFGAVNNIFGNGQ